MRIAVIGIGDIAQKAYLPVLTQLKGVELVFCTRNKNRLQQLALQYRIKEVYQDYRQLSKVNIDAVMIHSSTASHPEICAYFLQLGLPVFVDKPLADNAFDCERLYELAEKSRLPLYMGFNRRFIPLYIQYLPGLQCGSSEPPLLSLRWEKNRHNLPADIRTFVFDDFIHPLDSINIGAKSNLDGLQLSRQFQGKQLARLDVQWQLENTIFEASMNRLYGITCERVCANFANRSYEFDSFVSGRCLQDNQETIIRLQDWIPMLDAKGFCSMIEDWISVVKAGKLKQAVVERNLASHQLAEAVCQKIQSSIS
ncbi:Gfo/Idh/MocA family protein [Psychromonas aquimarina]|uniref:Gfo/Idh/MocA family protein n=1 Tax=Psychromonas aquimarina TaxID=444919 RepID=UPI000413DCF9|nr:Gfo/Idh/MocA family oxidoreductase [Psychromonas aquimarina]